MLPLLAVKGTEEQTSPAPQNHQTPARTRARPVVFRPPGQHEPVIITCPLLQMLSLEQFGTLPYAEVFRWSVCVLAPECHLPASSPFGALDSRSGDLVRATGCSLLVEAPI